MPMVLNNNPLPRMTFANFPAPASVPLGYTIFATDVGAFLYSDGSRWKYTYGVMTLARLAASISGLTSSEVISLNTLIPANLVQVNDELEAEVQVDKSGTTDSATLRMLLGAAGTTADTQLAGVSAIGAANVSNGIIQRFKVVSATSIQRTGSISGSGSFSAPTATATPAAVAVTSLAANALYFGISLVSSGASNTVGIRSARLRHIMI